MEEREQLGGQYVQDYLYSRERRNCQPKILRNYPAPITVFLSYLKKEGRTSLGTITREDLSSFIERRPVSFLTYT